MRLISFPIKGDLRGSLVAIEGDKNIPFPIKRVYYIYDTKEGITRGCHAHKNLQQVLICICGSCAISLDNGISKEEVLLSSAEIGLYVGPGIWHEMKDFSQNAVLLVLASDWYCEDDYIRNYQDFLSSVKVDEKAGEA